MKTLISVSAAVALAQPVPACDLCSIYSASQAQGGSGEGVFGGVAEQFTHFGTVQENGMKIAGEGQYIESSVSQLFAGYNINNRVGLQLNLPVIYRAFGSSSMHGTESGIGDLCSRQDQSMRRARNLQRKTYASGVHHHRPVARRD